MSHAGGNTLNGKNIFIQFKVYICTVRTWPVTVDQVTNTSHPLSEAKTAVKFRSKNFGQIRQLSTVHHIPDRSRALRLASLSTMAKISQISAHF